ncbi:MAG: hypothetical protein HYT65_03020 [Candidatus Yanofskybacteria bacterium]|nr:hypothetical protein [Candidatus Yanofskybacteria bacterium]
MENLLFLSGLFFLVITLVSTLRKKTVFGIRPLIFELLGFAIMGLCSGLYLNPKLLWTTIIVMTSGFILAVLFDPAIWRWQGIQMRDGQKLSFFINSKAFIVFLSFIAVGRILGWAVR